MSLKKQISLQIFISMSKYLSFVYYQGHFKFEYISACNFLKIFFMFEYKCMHVIFKIKCIFKYKCMYVYARAYGSEISNKLQCISLLGLLY